MAYLESGPNLEQISQPKPTKRMTPREIREELHQGDGEADETKLQTFPSEGKIPGSRRVDLGTKDALTNKEEQLKLMEELEKMGTLEEIKKDEEASLNLIKKLKFGDKEETRMAEVRERFAKKKEAVRAVQKELDAFKTKPTSVESIIEGLKETTKAGEEKRIAGLKEEKERIARLRLELKKGEATAKPAADLDRFQKIPVTPEYKAKLQEWRMDELSAANKTLLEAEDALAEAEKQRPGVFSRFFSRFKIGKPSTAETAYQTAFQDKNISPADLKKMAAAAGEAMTYKPLTAETTYQKALLAKKLAEAEIKRIEEEAENQGEAIIGSHVRPHKTHLAMPIPTSPYAIKMHGSAPPASKRAPFQPPGESFKLKFVEPFSEPTKPEISSEAMTNAKQHLKNFVKNLFFNYPDNKNLILQDMAFQENLAANNFIGDFQTLTKTIMESQEQLAGELKLSPREQNAALDTLMAKLNARTKKMSAIDAEKYRYYLALKDLEQIAPGHQIAPKRRGALETGAAPKGGVRSGKIW